jgi:hypothetical protein
VLRNGGLSEHLDQQDGPIVEGMVFLAVFRDERGCGLAPFFTRRARFGSLSRWGW